MKRRYNRIAVGNELRYTVEEKRNIFSKWELLRFTFEGGREHVTELTLEEFVRACGWYCPENKEIDDDITAYMDELERKDHLLPYQISKYCDEKSRVVEILARAASLEELLEQLQALINDEKGNK